MRDGYSPVDRHGNEVNGFKPPIDSWREHPNEWVVEYVRSDALRNFRLHCSLQPGTGRMFVHASELKERQGDPLRENIQVRYSDGLFHLNNENKSALFSLVRCQTN